MRSRHLFRILFILYCVEAGVFLAFVPWSTLWERHLLELPWIGVRALGLHPLWRSALTGFGLVHLVWGIHDLELLLEDWRRSRSEASEGSQGPRGD